MTKFEIEVQIDQWEVRHATRCENLGPNSEEALYALDKIRQLNEAWLLIDAQETVFGE